MLLKYVVSIAAGGFQFMKSPIASPWRNTGAELKYSKKGI
jgi:hypothetical protein